MKIEKKSAYFLNKRCSAMFGIVAAFLFFLEDLDLPIIQRSLSLNELIRQIKITMFSNWSLYLLIFFVFAFLFNKIVPAYTINSVSLFVFRKPFFWGSIKDFKVSNILGIRFFSYTRENYPFGFRFYRTLEIDNYEQFLEDIKYLVYSNLKSFKNFPEFSKISEIEPPSFSVDNPPSCNVPRKSLQRIFVQMVCLAALIGMTLYLVNMYYETGQIPSRSGFYEGEKAKSVLTALYVFLFLFFILFINRSLVLFYGNKYRCLSCGNTLRIKGKLTNQSCSKCGFKYFL